MLALVIATAPVQAAGKPKEDKIAGVYTCAGVSAAGKPYVGIVEIVATGATYHVRWTFPNSTFRPSGVALKIKGRIVVAYNAGDRAGLAVYEIKGKTGKGVWTMFGFPQTWTENIEKQPAGTSVPDPPADDAAPQHNPHNHQSHGQTTA